MRGSLHPIHGAAQAKELQEIHLQCCARWHAGCHAQFHGKHLQQIALHAAHIVVQPHATVWECIHRGCPAGLIAMFAAI